MDSLGYYYWIVGVTVLYLLVLLIQKRYRLLLPSTIHTFIWLVTAVLIILELKGIGVTQQMPNNKFHLVSRFSCFIVCSSIIGFTIAHIFTAPKELISWVRFIDKNVIDAILVKFRWIPYGCGIVGLILFIFLLSVMGDISSFSDYRRMALFTERVGFMSIVQRISGHINILGFFYLLLLGYKSGQEGIQLKTFFKYAILCSAINMSIGGRVWIVTSILPFMITYVFTRHYSMIPLKIKRSDNRKFLMILILSISMFSIVGLLRGDEKDETNFVDKFLYLTDGSKMTNMVLSQYPENMYELEYGRSEFLYPFIGSSMAEKFQKSIAHDPGLSVTVKSIMPYLYFDFGIWGGVLVWGVICFIIECLCIRFKYSCSIMGLLWFGQLAYLLFQTPVGHIFSVNTPVFEWLILIFIFRKWIFGNISNVKQYM